MSGIILVISVFYGFVALLTISVTLTNISSRFYNFGCTIPMGIGMLTAFLLYEFLKIPLLATFPLSAISGGIFSVVLYLVVFKPVIKNTKSSVLTSLTSLGLVLVFKNGLTVLSYYINLHVPSEFWCNQGVSDRNFSTNHFHFRVDLFGLERQSILILLMVGVIVVLTGIWKFGFEDFYKYRLRALKENPDLLRTQGVDVNKIQVIVWFTSGCLSALAGCLLPIIFKGYPGISLDNCLIIVALSSLLAGLFSFSWAVVIGLTLGINEIFTTTFMQSSFGAYMGDYRAIFTVILWLILVVFFRKIGLWDEPDFE